MKTTLNYDKGLLYGFQFIFSTKRNWVLWYRKYEGRLEFNNGVMNGEKCVSSHADIISCFKNSDDDIMFKFAHELIYNKVTEAFWTALDGVEREELESFFDKNLTDAITECARRYNAPNNVFVKYVGNNANGIIKDFFYMVLDKGEALTKVSNGNEEMLVPNNFLEFK